MDATKEDLVLINRLLLDLYRLSTPDRQAEMVLKIVNQLVPSTMSTWTSFNVQTRSLNMTTLPAINMPEAQVREVGALAHQSPFPAYFAATGDRSWRMLTDFMPTEEFQQTELYAKMLAPMGGIHLISTMLAGVDHEQFSLTLCRTQPGYSERDRTVLNLIHPHLSLSYYNAHAYERAQKTSREYQCVVENSESGYAYLGDTGRIEWATAKARELWTKFCPAEVCDVSGVPGSIRKWLVEARAQADAGDLVAARYSAAPQNGEVMELRLLPSQLGGWILSVTAQPAALRSRFVPMPELTERENEVLRWMTEGKRNGEIAIILAISVRTVDHHVTAVLTKLQVENRASAIVTALQLAATPAQ